MSLIVKTGHLRGYADQIDQNRSGAVASMRTYCAQYCADTTGLTGLLTPARWAVESSSEALLTFLGGADRGLWLTAYDLRLTADNYDRADAAAADRLWTTGRTWNLPADHREQDVVVVTNGFSAGAAVRLVVPTERRDSESAKESVYGLLGHINDIVKWVTGYDLLAEALPLVLGEWGTLRRIAEAMGELERGAEQVADNLEHGMDLLSAHWTGDAGSASTAFDYHMRDRLIRGFGALANVFKAYQQTYEWIANAYEYIINSFLLALNFYTARIKKAVATLATTDSLGKAAWSLLQLVLTVVDLIKDTGRVIELQTKMFASSIEMMVANLHSMYEIFGGDLTVFTEA
ncbi:hypothetical protein GCM10027280_46230 [Micromonospora polyrhachis]|uniref:Uncharacterized protein n=1 Tax=Micromonospora polyrhachis TaxID=1282883 RepID=A0A7W7SQS6_9ACTN|nr:hypothetical protein [Micromonospora polyrhachis]MBB4959233.1 hypothetical protein [Micromonospora polyrhachis]